MVAPRGEAETGLARNFFTGANMNRSPLYGLLALFFAVFLVCAGLLQLRSGLPPQKSGPLDQFNAALLWGSSVLALLAAAEERAISLRLVLWLAMSAGFGALAIDEVFEFHEGTRFAVGDDDYIKIAAWACSGAGCAAIAAVARPGRAALGALAIGFGFTTAWLATDLGDGDFFTLPIPVANLLWLEEYCELIASQFYLTAFILHYRDLLAASSPARPARFAWPRARPGLGHVN